MTVRERGEAAVVEAVVPQPETAAAAADQAATLAARYVGLACSCILGSTSRFAALDVLERPPRTRPEGWRSRSTAPATGTRSSRDLSTASPVRPRPALPSTPFSTNTQPTSTKPAQTSCPWLNAVEGLVGRLTRRRLKRSVFRSVAELRHAVQRFIEERNRTEAKRFVWISDHRRIVFQNPGLFGAPFRRAIEDCA